MVDEKETIIAEEAEDEYEEVIDKNKVIGVFVVLAIVFFGIMIIFRGSNSFEGWEHEEEEKVADEDIILETTVDDELEFDLEENNIYGESIKGSQTESFSGVSLENVSSDSKLSTDDFSVQVVITPENTKDTMGQGTVIGE